ncbi:SdiA-regulated domain-containing protein [Gillisia limnaea]|uniref:Uncharacterized protein n=1 Tax=Gillisia limnaea (strain DSM 15749 / LMG 21470 / R-8282) TaxID=865937 RepID=H2BQN7_GILLR|nr:hypothetical protein Gilli_0048 [Gillisia limnaea DSM 15749]
MHKVALLIAFGVLILVGFIYFSSERFFPEKSSQGAQSVEIINQWDLPDILVEVSGISYMENGKIACVQDEDGFIFIYNLESASVERKIEFAGHGDYEGIALVGTTAYVLRSDGTLFEVKNFENNLLKTNEYSFDFPSNYDFEGLGYDQKKNRLLLGFKSKTEDDFKSIYAFDLDTKKMKDQPVYKIYFNDPVFDILDMKPSNKMLQPSEISINPDNGKIYILEGINPKLLILDSTGIPEKLHVFKKKQFRQAEGLTFGPTGELFISNEGNGNSGNILHISLN